MQRQETTIKEEKTTANELSKIAEQLKILNQGIEKLNWFIANGFMRRM